MSRGPGRVQRAILSSLSDEWLNVDAICATLNWKGYERAERESVRRAMRVLAQRGACQSRHNGNGELEITEALSLRAQALLNRAYAIDAQGGDGLTWLLSVDAE